MLISEVLQRSYKLFKLFIYKVCNPTSGKFSYERAAAALARRKKRESKPPKHKPINYKDYEKTALGWRKKIN